MNGPRWTGLKMWCKVRSKVTTGGEKNGEDLTSECGSDKPNHHSPSVTPPPVMSVLKCQP